MPLTIKAIRVYGTDPDQAIVVLPAYCNVGDYVAAGILKYLQNFGTVLVVNYGDPFDLDATIEDVIARLQSFKRAVFIGQSMGSVVAAKIIDQIELESLPIEMSIVALAGFSDASDIVMPVKLLRHILYWPLTSQTVNRLINQRFDRRAAIPVEPDVDRAVLFDHRRSLYRISGPARRAQFELMAGARRCDFATHPDMPSVYIRGRQSPEDNDGLVWASAAEGWGDVFPQNTVIDALELWHGTLVEQPGAFWARIAEAFNRIGLLPTPTN